MLTTNEFAEARLLKMIGQNEGTTLNSGHFSIVDSSGPALTSPVIGSVFRFHGSPPQIRFQWAEKQEALGYTIEINNAADFSNPLITRQSLTASLIVSQLESGTWYWRVKPSFPAAFEGETAFSSVSIFRMEQTVDIAAPAVEIPVIPAERAAVIEAPLRTTSSAPLSAPLQPPLTATSSPSQAQQAIGTRRYYTILPGDTLGRIARQYYGDPMLWNRISDANNITNPDLIHPGQVFLIP